LTHPQFLQAEFVLEEISYLQTEGPSEEDVSAILEIEQRAHENGLQVLVHFHYSIISGDIVWHFNVYG
jgi:hypothetical protein